MLPLSCCFPPSAATSKNRDQARAGGLKGNFLGWPITGTPFPALHFLKHGGDRACQGGQESAAESTNQPGTNKPEQEMDKEDTIMIAEAKKSEETKAKEDDDEDEDEEPGELIWKEGNILDAPEEHIFQQLNCVQSSPAKGIASYLFFKEPEADVYKQRYKQKKQADKAGTYRKKNKKKASG